MALQNRTIRGVILRWKQIPENSHSNWTVLWWGGHGEAIAGRNWRSLCLR